MRSLVPTAPTPPLTAAGFARPLAARRRTLKVQRRVGRRRTGDVEGRDVLARAPGRPPVAAVAAAARRGRRGGVRRAEVGAARRREAAAGPGRV